MISCELLIELQYSSLKLFAVLTNNVVRLVKKLDEKKTTQKHAVIPIINTCIHEYRIGDVL